jgi:hypothetical protein
MRAFAVIFGIVLAAVGGVIAYRAFFLEPAAAVIISETGMRQLPDTLKALEGVALLLMGASIALVAAARGARRK